MAEIILNKQLIESAVLEYSDMLMRLAYQRLRHKEAAEDIVQDAFLKLIKASSFRSEEHLKAWLIRVTINLCLDYLKSPKNKGEELLENRISTIETQVDVFLDEIKVLTPDERDAVYLFYYEGYKAKEIAKILKKSENAVYILLNKSRSKLKGYFEEDD